MPKILITRPEHDPLTRCLSQWSTIIIECAQEKGFSVTDLYREKANKKEFEGRIKKIDPSLVLLNGHGNDDTVTGHDNEILVKAGENEEILKKRITYAVACSSAKVLGSRCADQDTTFIGYDESFVLNLDRRFLSNPRQDTRSQKFLEPSNAIGIALIKGHACTEALLKSRRIARDHILSLLENTNDPDARDDAKDLFWNMRHQVCLGNAEAKL